MSKSSWGAGSSTSENEARAAAASGIAKSELAVNYALPPQILQAWQSSATQPGIALIGSDLRPQLMIDNVRATIFPHLQQQDFSSVLSCLLLYVLLAVQSSMALSMGRQAWANVESLERTYEWRCGSVKPRLRMVQPVQEEGHELVLRNAGDQQLDQASLNKVADQVKMPPVSAFETFLGRLWSGNLFPSLKSKNKNASITPVTGPQLSLAPSSSSSRSPSAAETPFDPSYTSTNTLIVTHVEPRFLASERWLIQRCDGNLVYRVQYFGSGDLFYTQVVPTDFKGLLAAAQLAFKQHFTPNS